MAGRDRATELVQICGERFGDASRSTARKRPSHGVPGDEENERERGRERVLEREERMRGTSRYQRPRGLATERRRQATCRPHRVETEACQKQRMTRHVRHRPKDLARELFPPRDER